MKRFALKATLAAAMFSGIAGAGTAGAATDAPKPDAAKAQQTATTVCAACHGANGQSPIPANPHLAAQQAEYITTQLDHFKSGVRKNPIMMGMAAMLAPEDMKAIGQYFAQQPPKPGEPKDAVRNAAGAKLYRFGNAATGVPACAACHSPTGAGMPAQYPRLAGQYTDYTIAQLKAFKAGERGKDDKDASGKMMLAIAAKMSEDEILAVAEYVGSLR